MPYRPLFLSLLALLFLCLLGVLARAVPARASTTTVDLKQAAQADLWLIKMDTPDPVAAGRPLTYTIVVTNTGPSPATGIILTDTFPAGLTLGPLIPSQGTCDLPGGSTLVFTTCQLGALANGASVTVTIVVTPMTAVGRIINLAVVTANESDPDTANNSDTEDTTVYPYKNYLPIILRGPSVSVADLLVAKTASPDPAIVDQPLTYTIVVTNTGPSPATGVILTDTFPPGLIPGPLIPSQGTCSLPGGSTLLFTTCQLGTLAESTSLTLTLVATPTVPGVITNTVSVAGNEFDPTTPNIATQSTAVSPAANLSVTMTDWPDPVAVGRRLTYTVVVTNHGPSPATGAILTGTFPVSLILGPLTPSQGGCGLPVSGSLIFATCQFGALASGAGVTVTIVATPTLVGRITSSAAVAANEFDPDTADNSDTEDTAINPYKLYLPVIQRNWPRRMTIYLPLVRR